jgi:hypothetical protein
MGSRALRETETETKTDRFSINQKYRFSVFPILVSFGFQAVIFPIFWAIFFVLKVVLPI